MQHKYNGDKKKEKENIYCWFLNRRYS